MKKGPGREGLRTVGREGLLRTVSREGLRTTYDTGREGLRTTGREGLLRPSRRGHSPSGPAASEISERIFPRSISEISEWIFPRNIRTEQNSSLNRHDSHHLLPKNFLLQKMSKFLG